MSLQRKRVVWWHCTFHVLNFGIFVWLDIVLPPDLTKHLKVFSFYGMWISLLFFFVVHLIGKHCFHFFVHVICWVFLHFTVPCEAKCIFVTMLLVIYRDRVFATPLKRNYRHNCVRNRSMHVHPCASEGSRHSCVLRLCVLLLLVCECYWSWWGEVGSSQIVCVSCSLATENGHWTLWNILYTSNLPQWSWSEPVRIAIPAGHGAVRGEQRELVHFLDDCINSVNVVIWTINH